MSLIIGIENLKYIRSRSRVTVKSQRDRHSKWAFGELRQFLTYKTKSEGVPLRVINSKNTSRVPQVSVCRQEK
ncbi:MAG: IS200/IS605 family accessory protein TnpB-related protein [Candidatus Nitrosopolaris sp.]